MIASNVDFDPNQASMVYHAMTSSAPASSSDGVPSKGFGPPYFCGNRQGRTAHAGEPPAVAAL